MKRASTKHVDKTSLETVRMIANAALDKKAEDLVILDVKGLSSFADYFVIMSGRSMRHVQGLAQAAVDTMSSKRMKAGDTEGLSEGQWVLLDYNDVVVHIFYAEVRVFYDLEGLWHDAPKIAVNSDVGE